MAVGNTSGDILRPCALGTARSLKNVAVYFHGFSVIVAFSICPASAYAQGVCKLPSAQSRVVVAQECRVCAAILASVSCMVWTVERSADEDRHTAVLGGKEVRGSTAMAQVCATSPLHSAHSSLLSLHRRPGPYVNTRLQSALRRNLPPRECRSHPALLKMAMQLLWNVELEWVKKRTGAILDLDGQQAHQICSFMWADNDWIMSYSEAHLNR